MQHILETATSTDIVIFQQGMQAAAIGLHFDPLADKFWKAGFEAFQENFAAKPRWKSSTRFVRRQLS